MATIKKDIGAYSAYAIAVKHGYEGTEAEWVAAQEKARVDSEAAAKAAQAAQEAAEAARKQAQTAKTGAENAQAAAAQQAQTATDAARTATQAAQAAQTAKEAAEQAQTGAEKAKTRAETAKTEAQTAKEAAEKAAQEAKAAQTGAVEAKTGAEAAQRKAEEAAQGVAADREQIGANKSGLEAAQQELTATKQQLTETKTALESTQDDLKKAQRAIQFQAEINKGQTWDFETDTQEAYQRQVPSGAKAGAVMAVGGKTVVWNQCLSLKKGSIQTITGSDYMSGITPGDVASSTIIQISASNGYNLSNSLPNDYYLAQNHIYLMLADLKYTTTTTQTGVRFQYGGIANATIKELMITQVWQDLVLIAEMTKTAHSVYLYVDTSGKLSPGDTVELRNPLVIDLTLLYGPGNEPTDTTDPRIAQIEAYAAAHPEYNAGELVSAEVDEVLVRGRNLIDDTAPDNIINYNDRTTYAYDNGVHKFSGNQSAQQIDTLFGPLYSVHVEAGKIYRLSFDVLAKNAVTHIYISKSLGKNSFYLEQADGSIIVISETNVAFGNSGAWNRVTCTFAATLTGNATLHMTIDTPDLYGVGSACWYKNIQFTAADITAYAPYHDPALYFIPAAVRNLPGYGWSAGSVANTVERTENGWQYVQRVGSRAYQEGDELTDGTTTYYALESPITTDITALMGDAMAPFAVEAGGSITLHHPKADEGFAIDVPAKIQYITKLSEVSANG